MSTRRRLLWRLYGAAAVVAAVAVGLAVSKALRLL